MAVRIPGNGTGYENPFEYDNASEDDALLRLQLEKFGKVIPQRLKLNEAYELLPKDVVSSSPDIEWLKISDDSGDRVAKPFQTSFQIYPEDDRMMMTIKPTTVFDGKNYLSHFPGLRESRIEHAILLIAARELIKARMDGNNTPTLRISTSIYQIRKEIIHAIRVKEGVSLEDKLIIESCPYSKKQIKEGLEILKETNYRVTSENGQTEYHFNRIKDYGRQDDKLFIELGSMLSESISNGLWQATNATNLIASRSLYMVRLIKLLQFKFTYAKEDRSYNSKASTLAEKLGYPKSMHFRQVRHKIKALLEECDLVSHFREETRNEKNKVIDSLIDIYPSKKFVTQMIEDHALNKRLSLKDQLGTRINPNVNPLLRRKGDRR